MKKSTQAYHKRSENTAPAPVKRYGNKPGDNINGWILEQNIGEGGNGIVWLCQNDKGEKCAIKFLKKVKEKAYTRFIDETKVLEQNGDIEGIVPLIGKYLPENLKEGLPYFIMPVAAKSESILRSRRLEQKISAIIQIARTVAVLHERKIYHRDIKTSNILYYNERFCLADFGLVDYPEKTEVSVTDEEIGPKWTMAPEMKRESSSADPSKADIYSLGKTMWIILRSANKGFDGQYITGSILSIKKSYPDRYLTPLENLLTAATNNDPDLRPTIQEFIVILEDWLKLDKSFNDRNIREWLHFQQQLFPVTIPERAIWTKPEEIVTVLNIMCSYPSLTHTLFPGHGGMDLQKASLSHEEGCIELDFSGDEVVKPARLIFESFGTEYQWNYLRLELAPMELLKYNDQDEWEAEERREVVSELSPASYYTSDMLRNRHNYEDDYDIPRRARLVRRWQGGNFLFVSKRSLYNLASETYDGRHDRMSTDQFRKYITDISSGVRKKLQAAGKIAHDEVKAPMKVKDHMIREQLVHTCKICRTPLTEEGKPMDYEDHSYQYAVLRKYGSSLQVEILGDCCKD